MFYLLAAGDPMEEVVPHALFGSGPYAITNQMFMAVVAAVLMLLIFPSIFPQARGDAPKGWRNFFESILEFLRVEVFQPALKEHTDRFVPFLWTLFFFILFCNLLGQLPVNELIGLFTHREVYFWGTATGTPTTTAALAISAFVFIHISGIMQVARSLMDGTYGHHEHHDEHTANGVPPHEAAHDLEHARSEGLAADVPNDFRALGDPTSHYGDSEYPGRDAHAALSTADYKMNPVLAVLLALPLYIWNFAPHPFRPQPGTKGAKVFLAHLADVPMWFFLLVLELLGAIIKPFALTVRLFANMIAGHIVLAALLFMIPVTATFAHQLPVAAPVVILSLVIRMLELFVAFLQAYVFTFLVTLFIASAVAPEH